MQLQASGGKKQQEWKNRGKIQTTTNQGETMTAGNSLLFSGS